MSTSPLPVQVGEDGSGGCNRHSADGKKHFAHQSVVVNATLKHFHVQNKDHGPPRCGQLFLKPAMPYLSFLYNKTPLDTQGKKKGALGQKSYQAFVGF